MSPVQSSQGRTPGRPQGMPGAQQAGGQPTTTQARLQVPMNFQERLARMTPEQLNAFMYQQQQRRAMAASQNLARVNGQRAMPMQTSVSQPASTGQPSGSNLRASAMPMQQSLSGMDTTQPPSTSMAGAQMPMQPRQQQQQQQQYQQFQTQQQQQQQQMLRPGSLPMTPEQQAQMDQLPFPPQILNGNQPVPPTIKTWGQLKQWISQNPHGLSGITLHKLHQLQQLHFYQTMRARNSQRAAAEQGGKPWGEQQAMNGQPMPGMPPTVNLPPVTPNDIAIARQQLGPKAAHLTDDQLRTLIQRSRHKKYLEQAQSRSVAAAAAAAAQGMHRSQPPQQPAQTQAGAVAPTSAAAQQGVSAVQMPAMTTAAAGSRTVPAKVPAQQSPGAAVAGKTPAKSAAKTTARKRPSDEVVEMPNSKAQPVSQPPTTQFGAATSAPMNARPAGIEHLTPTSASQQQGQGQARRPARQPIPRTIAEENWNRNLPEPLKKFYADAVNSAPPPVPTSLTPEEKAAMTNQLMECVDMLSRLDSLVQWLATHARSETQIRGVFSTVRPTSCLHERFW